MKREHGRARCGFAGCIFREEEGAPSLACSDHRPGLVSFRRCCCCYYTAVPVTATALYQVLREVESNGFEKEEFIQFLWGDGHGQDAKLVRHLITPASTQVATTEATGITFGSGLGSGSVKQARAPTEPKPDVQASSEAGCFIGGSTSNAGLGGADVAAVKSYKERTSAPNQEGVFMGTTSFTSSSATPSETLAQRRANKAAAQGGSPFRTTFEAKAASEGQGSGGKSYQEKVQQSAASEALAFTKTGTTSLRYGAAGVRQSRFPA